MKQYKLVSESEMIKHSEYIKKVRAMNTASGEQKYAYIQTFGCQQNVADSEKIAGMCVSMGYKLCNEPADADLDRKSVV